MRVLVLVISDSSHPVYEHHRMMWRDSPKHPDVDVYFVESSTEVDMPQLQGDVFMTPGKDTYRAIIRKTVDAFDYFLPPGHPYQWVVRTNLSSHYSWPRLLEFLSAQNPSRFYGGLLGYYENIPFVGGSGVYMSSDVCAILQAHRKRLYDINLNDDVAMGRLLHGLGIRASGSDCRTDFHGGDDFQPSKCGGFHFRIKYLANSSERILYEVDVRRRLMEILANPTSQ